MAIFNSYVKLPEGKKKNRRKSPEKILLKILMSWEFIPSQVDPMLLVRHCPYHVEMVFTWKKPITADDLGMV